MTLIDTGPLVALLDKGDLNHTRCAEALRHLPAGVLVTTWPCFTEAMYLLGRVGGYRYQERLWLLVTSQKLTLYAMVEVEIKRAAELMQKYQNVPMDLADASLVVVAESLNKTTVFSLDSDFYIYRLADGSTMNIVP